jgi:hypothetical protein
MKLGLGHSRIVAPRRASASIDAACTRLFAVSQATCGRDHRSRAFVDGVDDLGVVESRVGTRR